jgi:hypothetical protein
MEKDYEDEFYLYAENGNIYFSIEEVYGFPGQTSAFGGYDTRSSIEIESSNYRVKGSFYITTAELFRFYKQLQECYKTLKGAAVLTNYEGNLKLVVEMDGLGHARITGFFREKLHEENELRFELHTDQTHLAQPVYGLYDIASVYGDERGNRVAE